MRSAVIGWVMDAAPHALVVRGGWKGHHPRATTDSFAPFLRANGYRITARDDLDAYLDADLLAATDLVVQCWSIGELDDARLAGLAGAVAAGTGFAGWHGGIVGAFLDQRLYHLITGGVFLDHPGDFVDHEIVVRPERADHPIVRGIGRIRLHTEQYWVLTDALNDVLATTTLPAGPGTPWREPVTVPAVWTRRWGAGRVFVCTVGHHPPDLAVPEIRTIVERGLLWASRVPAGR
jgi:type 1 glutamine amidotransferase